MRAMQMPEPDPCDARLRRNRRQRFARLRVLLLLGLVGCSGASSSDLRPFTTDGCSQFPDGTPSEGSLWLHCCTEHDVAYWQGGTPEQRRQADRSLAACVTAVGKPLIAKLMLAGVRVGGTPYLPTTYRWGYGWPWPRGYRPLTPSEREAVARALGDTGAVQ